MCKKVALADSGRILESVVFLELKKQGEIFYFEEEKECDFILKNFSDEFMPYQVTYELHDKNNKREMEGLVNAYKQLTIHKGTVLTFD